MASGSAKAALFDALASVAQALGSGRRAEIIDVLAQGERSVEELAGEISQSVANTSQHLQVLSRAGLVRSRREGTRVFYRLASDRVDELWAAGIRNILALRGDPPSGQSQFVPTEGGFPYANELVSFVRSRHDFCIAVAGYPEGHPQCLNRTRDMEHLKRKVDNGANFIVTQLFFDNAEFYRFRENARAIGIKVPIIAGIMPILNLGQIKRFISMCGAKIPHPLLTKLESLESDPEAVAKAGVEYATRQCQDLLFHGVEGIHFYTLNKSKATVEICQALKTDHAV